MASEFTDLDGLRVKCDSLTLLNKTLLTQVNALKQELRKYQKNNCVKKGQTFLSQDTQLDASRNMQKINAFASQERGILYKGGTSLSTSLNIGQSPMRRQSQRSDSRMLSPATSFIPVQSDFVPARIKLQRGSEKQIQSTTVLPQTETHRLGVGLLQDFLLIGPQLKSIAQKDFQPVIIRQNSQSVQGYQHKQESQRVVSHLHFNFNPLYNSRKNEFLKEIVRRVFSQGVRVRRAAQYQGPNLQPQMGDFFAFTLQPDEQMEWHGVLSACNSSRLRFVICLKIFQKIQIQNEEWVVEKAFVIVSYYPFLDIHYNILRHVYCWERECTLNRKKVFGIARDRTLHQLLQKLTSQQVVYGQSIKHGNYYFGSVPREGFQCTHALSLFTAPLFFSLFAHQECLLLLTALLHEHSLIFIGRREAQCSICALFLLSIITPFQFAGAMLLNRDIKQQINFVFDNPFTIITSIIAKPHQLQQSLAAYLQGNQGRKVLVHIESNTLLFDGGLKQSLFTLGTVFQNDYLYLNPLPSHSLHLPRPLQPQQHNRVKNQQQRREQERRRQIKDLELRIEQNMSHTHTWRRSPQSDRLVIALDCFFTSLTLNQNFKSQLKLKDRKEWLPLVTQHLNNRHTQYNTLLKHLLQTQLYAVYLDRVADLF